MTREEKSDSFIVAKRVASAFGFTGKSLSAQVCLLGVGLAMLAGPLMAQTDADVLIRTSSPVGAFVEEMGFKLDPVRVYTGSGEKLLTLEVGLAGTTLYSDGNVGGLKVNHSAGKIGQGLGTGFGGSITSTRTGLSAQVSSSPQASLDLTATNGGSATGSSSASVHSVSYSTGSN